MWSTFRQVALTAAYLEEFFKRGVDHRIGHKGEGVEGEKLCGLAQGSPFGFQVGFEIRNPLI